MEALSANGNAERAELLKQHADEEVCALVLSLIDKVGELWQGPRTCRTTANSGGQSAGEDGDDGRPERCARVQEQSGSGGIRAEGDGAEEWPRGGQSPADGEVPGCPGRAEGKRVTSGPPAGLLPQLPQPFFPAAFVLHHRLKRSS